MLSKMRCVVNRPSDLACDSLHKRPLRLLVRRFTPQLKSLVCALGFNRYLCKPTLHPDPVMNSLCPGVLSPLGALNLTCIIHHSLSMMDNSFHVWAPIDILHSR
jgi:hypothetical protein